MAEPEIKIEMGKYKPKWYVNFADFANMVKAFIGSNYLSIAYAFLQSGIVLGLCGMALIAGLTDHCCHLIAKTKHHIIRKHLEKLKYTDQTKNGKQRNNYSSIKGNTPGDSGVEDESVADDISPFISRSGGDEDSDTESNESYSDLEEHMMKHLTYGEIGKKCFGGKGLGMVNFFIALTQFGFCVGYFIFIGNTMYSIFPMELCQHSGNQTTCHIYYDLEERPHLNTSKQIDDTLRLIMAVPYSFEADPNSSTVEPQNISTTTSVPENITTALPPDTTASLPFHIIQEIRRSKPNLMLLVASPLPIFLLFAFIRSVRALGMISVIANCCILGGCIAVFAFLLNDFEVHATITLAKFSTFPVFFGMVTAAFEGIGLVIPIESSMVGNRELFPCFLHGALAVLTFILGSFGVLGYLKFGEDVHQMLNTNIPAGEILSDIVNIGICIGILLTFPLQIYPVIEILEKYLFSEVKIIVEKMEMLPAFPPFPTVVSKGFFLGLLKFGIVAKSINPLPNNPQRKKPSENIAGEEENTGRICGPKREDKMTNFSEEEEEEEQLIRDDDKDPLLSDEEMVTSVPESVPRWKRNILRIIVVIVAGGLAVLLKDNFAYVGAFVGAVGSSVLAFILPCLFHLKVCWMDVNIFIKIKDILIICFGVVASVISVISVIERIAKNTISH